MHQTHHTFVTSPKHNESNIFFGSSTYEKPRKKNLFCGEKEKKEEEEEEEEEEERNDSNYIGPKNLATIKLAVSLVI